MIKRTFDPGFRIALHQKDLNLALDGAKSLGLALPGTALAQQLFSVCAANGAGDADHFGPRARPGDHGQPRRRRGLRPVPASRAGPAGSRRGGQTREPERAGAGSMSSREGS